MRRFQSGDVCQNSVTQMSANPSVSEFKQGWRIVLGAAFGVGFGITGLPFYTLGVFLKPLAGEFHWTRGAVSVSALCLHLGWAVMAPFVGRLADIIDVRRLGMLSLAGLSLGFLGASQITGQIWTLYLALTLLAMAGSASIPIVWTRVVTGWFDKSRGLALALTLVGTGVASILAPLTVTPLIQNYGWRVSYVVLAAITAFIAIPVVALLFGKLKAVRSARQVADFGVTLGEAVRSAPFWYLMIAFFFASLCVGGSIVHLIPLLTDNGMTPVRAASVASLLGVATIIGRLGVGYLLDIFPARYVSSAFLLVPVIGCLILATGQTSTALSIAAAITFGLAAGAEVDLIAYLIGRYFGLKAYGRIYGWVLVAFGLGAAFGPPISGYVFDAAGNYRPALYTGAVLYIIAAGLLLRLGPVRYGGKH